MSAIGPTLVTGGARRLGRAVVERLARAEIPVVIHARTSIAEAEALADHIRQSGGQAAVAVADLDDPNAAGQLIAKSAAAIGAPLTGLINCAAIFEHDTLDTFDPALLQRHIEINTASVISLIRCFSAALAPAARGSVINFLDFKLASPYPDHFSYTLSKYALAGASEMLARSLAPRIRVNSISPGFVLPGPGQSEEDFARLHAQTPLQLGATTEHIADAALFLMQTPSITGQTIYVDAGLRFLTHERDFLFR